MSLIIVITNISQLAPVSDYNYQVLIGNGTVEGSRNIAHGQILGHQRDKGWLELVDRLVKQEGGEPHNG